MPLEPICFRGRPVRSTGANGSCRGRKVRNHRRQHLARIDGRARRLLDRPSTRKNLYSLSPEADEREGRIRPVYGAKEAHADPKTEATKRKVLGLSLGGRKRRPYRNSGGAQTAMATAGMALPLRTESDLVIGLAAFDAKLSSALPRSVMKAFDFGVGRPEVPVRVLRWYRNCRPTHKGGDPSVNSRSFPTAPPVRFRSESRNTGSRVSGEARTYSCWIRSFWRRCFRSARRSQARRNPPRRGRRRVNCRWLQGPAVT